MRSVASAGMVSGLMLTACSSFNMLADCAKTGSALAELMVVPRGERPDQPRLTGLVSVSPPEEIAAGYNERTCRADVTALGETHRVTYTVRQAEGVQGWGEYNLLPDPQVQAFIARMRRSYAG